MSFREETVDVRGYPVRLLRAGSGPPLLYLHGLLDAAAPGACEEALARHFEVLRPAHPGFAGSELPDWVDDVDDVALHTADLIETLALERPVVVGHSLGGWIATAFGVFRPEVSRALVLVSALGVRPESSPPDLFIQDPRETVATLFADPAKAAPLAPAKIDADFLVRRWQDQAAAARLMWKRVYDPRLRRRLHHVRTPTLVVWGERDAYLPASHGEKILAKELPNARFTSIPGAGHSVPLEAPEALAHAIVSFAVGRESD